MKMIDRPSSASLRRRAKISSVSCGVSTAVGSSSTSMRASRYRALRISTRCCCPTDRRCRPLRRGRARSRTGRQLGDSLVRLVPVKERPAGHRFRAEDDVLGDRQHRHEHEVLVDHADAASDGIRWPRDIDGLAVEQDLALVGTRQPVQDVHEGRLAGAVLAKQGVDLSAPYIQAYVVIGDDAGIALGNAAHLQSRERNAASPVTTASLAPGVRCNERAGPKARPAREVTEMRGYGPQVPQVAGQVVSVPAFIAARAASSLPWTSAGSVIAVLWNGEMPMPSLAALNLEMPPLAVPAAIAVIVWLTALERCFSAEVTMHLSAVGYDRYSSTSTPMPMMLAAQAASRAPLPVAPATWNRTSTPFCLMNWALKVLPKTGSP